MVVQLIVKGLLRVGKGVQCMHNGLGFVLGGRGGAQHLVNKKSPSQAQGACRDAIDK